MLRNGSPLYNPESLQLRKSSPSSWLMPFAVKILDNRFCDQVNELCWDILLEVVMSKYVFHHPDELGFFFFMDQGQQCAACGKKCKNK